MLRTGLPAVGILITITAGKIRFYACTQRSAEQAAGLVWSQPSFLYCRSPMATNVVVGVLNVVIGLSIP